MIKRQFKSLVGQRFERLLVLERAVTPKRVIWECLCDCGKKVYVRTDELEKNRTKSCGCRRKEGVSSTRHGLSRTSTYRSWMHMKIRGLGKEHRKYYFDRGIRICERWLKFENFLEDMGQAPTAKHSIDRINNQGHYEPGNCRWATRSQQASNTRRNIFLDIGASSPVTVAEACRRFNLSNNLLVSRKDDRKYGYQEAFNELVLEKGLVNEYRNKLGG